LKLIQNACNRERNKLFKQIFTSMKKKIFAYTGLAIVLLGITLLGYSFTLDRYTDVNAYNERYFSINSSSSDASEQFAALRDEYLTSKFALENYGLTTLILGVIAMIVGGIGYKRIKTPSKRIWLILIGLCASVLVCLASVGEIYLGLYRDSYPHWADSIGIALFTAPFLLLVFLLWTGIMLIWMQRPFISGVVLFPLNIRNSNKFLLIVLILTTIILLYLIVTGSFWMIIPGAFWIYFYISIIQGKIQAKKLNE
jgi:hypothetical protein